LSHVTVRNIHAYANRGLDLRIAVVTSELTTAFTVITFRVGAVEKTSLSADDTETGFDVDLTLTAAELDITPGIYPWELVATFGGQVRTVGKGDFTISEEPTEAPA
jgi:hypothetical protein